MDKSHTFVGIIILFYLSLFDFGKAGFALVFFFQTLILNECNDKVGTDKKDYDYDYDDEMTTNDMTVYATQHTNI